MSRAPHRLHLDKDGHRFSAAHMTVFTDGTKESLHGHNYQASVALDLADVSFARFFDFGKVKAVLDGICREWDHHVLIAERNPFFRLVRRDGDEAEFTVCGRRYVLPAAEVLFLPIENVAVETLAAEIARLVLDRLRDAVPLEVVTGLEIGVTESPGQGATCFREL